MFDLNDRKKYNDNYGHDYGDQYIKMAANAIKKLYFFGGDQQKTADAGTGYTGAEQQKICCDSQCCRGLCSL